jgi:hypothetical protein
VFSSEGAASPKLKLQFTFGLPASGQMDELRPCLVGGAAIVGGRAAGPARAPLRWRRSMSYPPKVSATGAAPGLPRPQP